MLNLVHIMLRLVHIEVKLVLTETGQLISYQINMVLIFQIVRKATLASNVEINAIANIQQRYATHVLGNAHKLAVQLGIQALTAPSSC